MATIAVLGGGISGLSCAYYLKKLGGSKIKYLFLLEKGPKFGGWIQTTLFPDGAVFEHGPRTMRIQGSQSFAALKLAEEIGLQDSVIPIDHRNPCVKNRFILKDEKIHVLPNNFSYLVFPKPPFKKPLFGAVLKDLRTPKCSANDETVFDFAKRRFGTEMAECVLDPMCRGICAHDARDTSIRTLFPSLFRMDQKYSSVIRGIFLGTKDRSLLVPTGSQLVMTAVQQNWRMWSLRHGLTDYVNALASSVEEMGNLDLHVNAECTALKFANGKCAVKVDGEDIEVDHVFSTIPSAKLAPLMTSYQELSQLLASIGFVSVAVVYLEFSGFVLQNEGFGFLVPSTENSKLLGILYDSFIFPEHNGLNRTRLTCMMGGKWFQDIFGSVDNVKPEQVLEIAIKETKRHLNITDEPLRYHVAIQKDCLPHYALGHLDKVNDINSSIKENHLCLSLLGPSYNTYGIPDLIDNAKITAENYVKSL